MPEWLQALLLVLAGSASAIRIGAARQGYAEPDQPALFCALLCFVLAAGVGACLFGDQALGLDTLAAEGWLRQATLLLGLPLVGLSALALARHWIWSRPTWGRLVLGLCACFELARQLAWSRQYALGVGLATALLVLYAGWLCWPARLQASAGAAAAVLLLAATVWPALPGGANPLAAYQPLCLALACPLLAWLLLALPERAHRPQPAVD